ncbi:hypothetical protein H4R35_005710 [Dimargaris xerosporica]|nr:hypothetical protein H4R35_005710 [Dimargaris xerosporica]
MELPTIRFTSKQFNSGVNLASQRIHKDFKEQHLEDPTVPKSDKQGYQKHPDSDAVRIQFDKYLRRRLKFCWDYNLPIMSEDPKFPQAEMMAIIMDDLRLEIYRFWSKHVHGANRAVLSVGHPELRDEIEFPDLIKDLPVEEKMDYEITYIAFRVSPYSKSQVPFSDVTDGLLGMFNADYVMDIPDLVKKYLEIINTVNLLSIIRVREKQLFESSLYQGIVRQGEDRAKCAFNDIMIHQVIPKLVGAYVAKGYYSQVLTFIDLLMNNTHVKAFWDRITDENRLNYYESLDIPIEYISLSKMCYQMQIMTEIAEGSVHN